VGKQAENDQMTSLLEQTLQASTAGSLLGTIASGVGKTNETGDLPSVLLSIMNQENIDYKNDFYWLRKVASFSCIFDYYYY
jgi:hypothetical protein